MATAFNNSAHGPIDSLEVLAQTALGTTPVALSTVMIVGPLQRLRDLYALPFQTTTDMNLTVQTFTSVSIYLAFESVPTETSGFCCQQAYNVSTQLCPDETHGSYDPFPLDSGAVDGALHR